MRTIVINNPGPQGSTGPQGVAGPSGSTQPFNNISGDTWATTSSLQVTGSFTNILESSSVKIQSNISSSFPVGSFYTSGIGWNSIVFSGSQTAFRSDTNGTYVNGLNEGNIYIPAFGLSFIYKGNSQLIATGSDFVLVGASYTDSTSIGGSRSLGTIQNGIFSGSYGKNEYLIGLGKSLNTEESSLYLTKRDNDGKTISLNLNSGNDGFSIFSTLSQPTSSFLKLVSGSNSNLVDFRYDANYIQRSTIIGSGTSTSPSAVLQVKGAGTTAYQLGLNVTDTNDKPLLFVQDNGYVGINRVPFSLDGQAWWNLHVSGTVASNNYVIGNTMYVNADVNPVFGGYPMLFKFTSSAAGYANVDFQIQSDPNLSFIAPSIGQTPIFTVKYDGKVGIGANNTQPQYTLDVSGSGNFNNNLTVTGSAIISSSASTQLQVGNNLLFVSSSGNVGIGTGAPLSSSILQIESTTRGFLIPRMTTTQRDAISSPATGLQIFNNTEGYTEYYDSFWGWMPVANQNEWKRKWGTEYFNDFGANNAFTGDGVFQTFPVNGGSYMSFNPLPLASDYIGFMGLSTGVNSNGQNAIRTDLNVGIFFRPAFRISLISRLWLQTLSDVTNRYNVIFGLSQGANSTIANGCAFIYDEGGVGTGTTASPNWQIITAFGNVRTNFVTSVVVATSTWYSFIIESNSTFTEIKYYINDTLVLTETTNIPTSVQNNPVVSITKTAGTTNRAVAVDYLGLKVKLNSAR